MAQRHLSSGDDARRASTLRMILALTIVLGVPFMLINIAQSRGWLAVAEAGMVVYSAVLWRLRARGLGVSTVAWAYLLPALAVLVFALFYAANRSIFVWVFLIPALSHRLLGARDGSVVGGGFLVAAGLIMLARFGFQPSLHEWASLSDLVACATVLFLISWTHEFEITRVDHALRERADIDALTGLASRSRFRDMFEQARKAAQRGEPGASSRASLILIDLDHFKQVNDTYGHDVGDVVLSTVSSRLLNRCRDDDLLGRIGGEELAILMLGVPHEVAARRAETLRRAIADMPVIAKDAEVRVTLSLGVVTFDLANTAFRTAFSRADARLYAAKRAGRNRAQSVEVADEQHDWRSSAGA